MPLAGDVTSFRCKCAHEVSLFLVLLAVNTSLIKSLKKSFQQDVRGAGYPPKGVGVKMSPSGELAGSG